jgi:hypothetical protein
MEIFKSLHWKKVTGSIKCLLYVGNIHYISAWSLCSKHTPRITKMECQLYTPFKTVNMHLHFTEGVILVKLIWLTDVQLLCFIAL